MIYTVQTIRTWLRDAQQPDAGPNDNQDFFHCLANEMSATQLIDLFETDKTVGNRIDDIALAICDRLEWLFDPDEDPKQIFTDADREAEKSQLFDFIRANLKKFTVANERTCLGDFFENEILPVVSKRTP